MKKTTTISILLIFLRFLCSGQYPKAVLDALAQTKNNRAELIKALDYFHATGDSLKIKSIDFLVANMPIHNSYNYYWANDAGHRIAYNELDYGTFNDAIISFDRLKAENKRLHPVANIYRDIDSIKASYLIDDVDRAIASWKSRHAVLPRTSDGSLEVFLEYVLPYRISVEPLENWRKDYAGRYNHSFSNDASTDSFQLRQTITAQFKNLWGTENTVEPLPRLGAMQILLRGKGYCEDIADLAAFVARSQGIPATVDNVPFWATATGNHYTNYLAFDNGGHQHFDAVLDSLGREPGKVLRTTYSAQMDAVATWSDTSKLPSGFLRIKNYRDVTREYWPVADIKCKLFERPNTASQNLAFLAVMNNGSWQPVWYGKIKSNTCVFKQMGKGAVYLPMYYRDHRLVPGGWPQALGYHNSKELKPDFEHNHTIVINEQEKHLKYRLGKRYRLFCWNKQWQFLGEQTANQTTTQLTFAKVPADALLILVPEYSQGKERPFMVLWNGERIWW